MITYKVCKKHPRIRLYLFKIFQPCMKCSTVTIQWQLASSLSISFHYYDFRPIALLKVEGKFFFSLVWKWIEDHLLVKNKFINVSIQKRCMAEVPSCWEHMSLAHVLLVVFQTFSLIQVTKSWSFYQILCVLFKQKKTCLNLM